MINRKETEYQQIKINYFQMEQKTVQESLNTLEAEMASLRELIEIEKKEEILILGPLFCMPQSTDFIISKEVVILIMNKCNLLPLAENLKKVNCLNEKLTKIVFAVESLKKQWKVAHKNDIVSL